MPTPPPYVIVSPVRDEAAHIAQTLQSVVGQTVRPAKWVIVDDGSKDDTGSIVDSYAARHPWIEVIHRADRGHRVAGGGVMDAFYAGFTRVEQDAWDFVAKLDGDVSFHPDYFERCLEHFADGAATRHRRGDRLHAHQGRVESRLGGRSTVPCSRHGQDLPSHLLSADRSAGEGSGMGHAGRGTRESPRLEHADFSRRRNGPPQADGKRLRVLGGRLQERESELHQRLPPCLHACEVRKAHVLQALRRAGGRPCVPGFYPAI